MTINIHIKANVNNLTLSQIYELIHKFTVERKGSTEIIEFDGFKFEIKAEVNMSITYVITEIQ